MKKLTTLGFVCLLIGCAKIDYPDNIKPVTGFQLDRYLGKWYEVARLDHSFERGKEQVTATYSLRDDGGVKILNNGFDTKSQSWDSAEGKAYFVGGVENGHLKVSFFGPFYGSYVIFELDPNYQHAFIAGNDYSYLWLLSRSPKISADLKSHFIQEATAKGYAVEDLIWVNQSDK